MYLLFHIFTALTAGCMLAVLLKNKWAVFWCALGGLIPDVLDKVFGHFTFYEVIGTMHRMYFHSLLVALFCLIIGIILLIRNKNRIELFCMSIGIIIHFIGDVVWLNTTTFLWPLLGPLISPEGLQMIFGSGKMISLIICATELLLFGIIYLICAEKMKAIQKLIYLLSFAFLVLIEQTIFMLIFNAGGAQQANWTYFFNIMGQETSMFSEWVFGIATLILLILALITWLKHTRICIAVARGTGVGCIICGIILLIGRLYNVMLDPRYSFVQAMWTGAVMIACGCILIVLSKKLFSGTTCILENGINCSELEKL